MVSIKMWKETLVAYGKALSGHSPEENKDVPVRINVVGVKIRIQFPPIPSL
jgi:hypothetical protein